MTCKNKAELESSSSFGATIIKGTTLHRATGKGKKIDTTQYVQQTSRDFSVTTAKGIRGVNVLSLTFSKTPLSTDGLTTGHNNSALPLQLVKDGAPDPPRLRPLRPRLGGGGGGILLAGVVSRHERGDRRRRRHWRLMSKVGLQGVDRLGGDAAALARVGAGAPFGQSSIG